MQEVSLGELSTRVIHTQILIGLILYIFLPRSYIEACVSCNFVCVDEVYCASSLSACDMSAAAYIGHHNCNTSHVLIDGVERHNGNNITAVVWVPQTYLTTQYSTDDLNISSVRLRKLLALHHKESRSMSIHELPNADVTI